jgi:hypothetical protein
MPFVKACHQTPANLHRIPDVFEVIYLTHVSAFGIDPVSRDDVDFLAKAAG